MAQILLLILIYHILAVTAAFLIDEWNRTDGNPWALALFAVLCLTGCETAPINVGPLPDIKAVTTQNETTKKHIKTFTGHALKVQEHVDKSIEEGVREGENLQSVKKDLAELLKQ